MLSLDSSEMCVGDSCPMQARKKKQKQQEDLLKMIDRVGEDCARYRPAYELSDGNLERAGRASASVPAVTGMA